LYETTGADTQVCPYADLLTDISDQVDAKNEKEKE
jgi:hypothetical protein